MPSSDLTLVSSSSRRPLLLSNNGSPPSSSPSIPRPSPFASFLQSLLSTLLALLLTWRIFIFPSRKKEIENGERDVEMDQNPSDSDHQEQHPEAQSHLPQTQPAAPSSVLSLLNTDSLPETSSSSDNEERLPPLPALLQTSLPAYLDTINEEESDELRSVSSASFASPLTVVGPSPSPFGPSHNTASTHPISPLVRTSTENISDSEYKSPLAASPYHQKEDGKVSVEDGQLLSEEEKSVEEGKSEGDRESDDPRGLLLELAKLGKGQGSLTSSKPAMSDEKQHHDDVEKSEGENTSEEKKTVKFEEAIKKEETEGPLHVVEKAAELQEEPLTARPAVSSSQIIHPSVPPPPLPNTSPPTTVASPIPMADDAPLEADRDRDQEEELVYNEERRRTVTMDDTNSLRSSSIQLNTANTTRDGLNESVASNPLDESAAVYRSSMKATDQMGPGSGTGTPLHGQDDRRSPPLDLPPPPPIPSSHLSTSSASAPYQAPPSFPPPPVPSSTLFQTTSSLRKPEIFDRSDQGMSSPPLASIPPSLPAAQSSYSRGAYSSREDLRSDIPSRSTVREIPVQRAPSSVTSVLDYRMPSSYAVQPQENPDEYYRREILTRTIVTRSTEALSQPPLGRSSPIERYISYPDPNTREERTVDYKVTYHRDIEEEERRIREDQERRRREEEDRRRREEEARRLWEIKERELLERMRTERELKEKYFEQSMLDRERAEKDRIEHDRLNREAAEMERRREWERRENERRALEETELAKRRQLEKERLELERQEEERRERERLERERLRLEAERAAAEEAARRQAEVERIERERIERERLEIERIERIKRERQEREERERQREKEEEERLRKEREELLRIERERRELEIKERELLVIARREAEERERQRIEDEAREARRRQEERREAELLAEIQRQADERERLRRLQEREEQERLERIRREQQRIDLEKADAERRERERAEEERRERELLEASQRKKEQREKERLQDLENERKRQEEEERARQQREAERRAAAERERQRREEEDKERIRIAELERAAAMRRAEREAELDRQRERDELDRKAREIADMEKRENERRERERLEEERSIAELKEKEKRNQEIRDRERREAAEREAARKMDDRRSRDKLDIIVRERTEKERFEAEKRRLLAEKEALNKKKHHLLSSETLQKLTRPPYFSRDNLNTEVTTKVERQVIERIDRNLWVDEVPVQRQAISYSLDTTNDENQRDRLYNANDLTRNGSAKASRYHRARMDKARRDFYSGAPDSTEGVTDRFRKSVDDLTSTSRHPAELRGPLLSRFHDSEFKRPTDYNDLPYPRVGPSPYSQVPETDLDMVHNRRAESVVDYHRQSRRDQPEPVATDNHARSRSADYLMDRRTREETEVPENQLQKTMGESPRDSRLSEHELRFIKSTEKLTVPDWYREHRRTARPTDVDDGTLRRASRDALEGIDIPRGMFDKYRDEIENLRRSRTSLYDPNAASNRQVVAL